MAIIQTPSLDEDTPEWGDPYSYPPSSTAASQGFVSHHPPGSEGWPYRHLAYLRPWPPAGATTSREAYSNYNWPIIRLSSKNRPSKQCHHRQLQRLLIYNAEGESIPGDFVSLQENAPGHEILNTTRYQQIARSKLAEVIDIKESVRPHVELNPDMAYHPSDRATLFTVSLTFCNAMAEDILQSCREHLTLPPCKWVTLCHPEYPWTISVTAAYPRHREIAGLTVEDAIKAIYKDLLMDVSLSEACTVPGIDIALQRHSRSLSQHTHVVGALKRFHWLAAWVLRFTGFSPDLDDPQRWWMHFASDHIDKPLPPVPNRPWYSV